MTFSGTLFSSSMAAAVVAALFVCVYLVAFFCLRFFEGRRLLNSRLIAIEKISSGMQGAEQSGVAKQRKRIKLKYVKVPAAVRKTVVAAGVDIEPEEFFLVWIVCTFIPAGLVNLITQSLLMTVFAVIVFALLPPWYINNLKKKNSEAFEEQLGSCLMLISNGLRSGFSFEQAFESSAEDSKDPLKKEFDRAAREMKMGVNLERALNGVTERTDSTNMRLVTSAVLVQRQVGGNLADILDGVSNTIRERITIRKNIKTLTAQGRISGIIIGSLPVFMLLVIGIINPSYVSVFTTTLIGRLMLAVCAFFELVGALIIRKIINVKF